LNHAALQQPIATDTPKQEEPVADAVLLQQIREGSHAAFSLLVQRYHRKCYAIAYRFMQDRALAEDMVQEAFLKLWERPAMWQENFGVSFIAWFQRVLVNLCLDTRKKKKPGNLEEDDWIADESESIEWHLIQRQVQQFMESQIADLPERQRVALNLCFDDELSNRQAAEVMGINLKALQSLIMRAKTTLKEKVRNSPYGIIGK